MTLRETRESLGLSQRAAAAALGIDQPTYCRVEQGKRTPKRRLIERVAKSGAPEALVAAFVGREAT